MHRIDGAGHDNGHWVAEDPATSRPPTEITADWMNTVQEEIATVIEAVVPLDKARNNQLLQAIINLITENVPQVSAATEESAGISELATATETISGVDSERATHSAGVKAAISYAISAQVASLQAQTNTAFTTAGTTGVYTLTPSPALAAYAANQRFRVKFHTAGTGSNTINISGLGVKSIKQLDATGAKVAGIIKASQLADIEYDGVDFVILNPLPDAYSAALSANGYLKLPNGLIIQWCSVTLTAQASVTASYPIAFPNAVFSVVGSYSGSYSAASGGDMGAFQVQSISKAEFSASQQDNGSNTTGMIIAIGN